MVNLIVKRLIDVHPKIKSHLLHMDLKSPEHVDAYYRLFFEIEALNLISDSKAMEKYYESLCELAEIITDAFYDDDYREDVLDSILSEIDDQYINTIRDLVGGSLKVSDIEKYSILKIYKLLCDFIAAMELEEEQYCKLMHEIAVFEIALSAGLYKKIIDFCETILAPEIDKNLEIVFTNDEAEEVEGVVHLKTQEAEKKLLSAYMEQLFDLENKIRDFGEEVLKPYLVA